MNKFLKVLFIFLACICGICIPIHAQDVGSITVELQDSVDGLSKENVELGIQKVASIVDGKYVVCDAFKSLNVDFNVKLNTTEYEGILTKIENLNLTSKDILVTDKDGIAKIENLELGVYYLYPINIHDYEMISSTLVSIPQWDDEELSYDIKILPKHVPFPKFEIQKIDSKSKEMIDDVVEFTLYSDASCENKIKKLSGKKKVQVLCNNSEFYIKETKAPSGYKINSQTIKVSVKDNVLYVDDKKVESGYELRFENMKETIPTATYTNFKLYTYLGVISGFIILILWFIKKRRV